MYQLFHLSKFLAILAPNFSQLISRLARECEKLNTLFTRECFSAYHEINVLLIGLVATSCAS